MELHGYTYIYIYIYVTKCEPCMYVLVLPPNSLSVMLAQIQLHLYYRLNTWLQWIGQKQLFDQMRNILVWGVGALTLEVWLSVLYDSHPNADKASLSIINITRDSFISLYVVFYHKVTLLCPLISTDHMIFYIMHGISLVILRTVGNIAQMLSKPWNSWIMIYYLEAKRWPELSEHGIRSY